MSDQQLPPLPPQLPADETPEIQEMSQRVEQLIGYHRPEPEMQARIRARLAAEWRTRQTKEPRWQSASGRARTWVLRLAFVAVLALAAALLLIPETPVSLPGTAQGTAGIISWVILGACLIGLLVIWWLRRRR
ncbi:MAG TPA: LPXTG cell wall anchor domain-containing protein [Anaerolineaceae bacterium]|nr:LPXTG cell wall anchor domain-containing protein [Anaerolineaceae bacterium]